MSYLMYLRKSQVDRDYEDVSETLSRHKTILNEFCARNKIPVAKVFEEVVSGESLSARIEMQKCLELINTGEYEGIVCMDIDRLSRGSSFDSGYIMQVLQFNGCKIVTPGKTYDLSLESDEQFTDMKFMFSRYELKQITKRMRRGVHESVKEGKHVCSAPPLGYDKVKLEGQKGYMLVPNKDKVIVQKIYELYLSGLGYKTISHKVKELYGLSVTDTTIKDILNNEKYIGKMTWGKQTSKKEITPTGIKRKYRNNSNYEIYEGLHEAIISDELWKATRQIKASKPAAPVPTKYVLHNELSKVIYCASCGATMTRIITNGKPYLFCSAGCGNHGAVYEDILSEIREATQNHFDSIDFDVIQENKTDSKEAELKSVRSTLSEAHRRLDKACEMLEQGIYTPELFASRNKAIMNDIKRCEDTIKLLESELEQESNFDIKDTINAWEVYNEMDNKERNMFWKSCVQSMTYSRPEAKKPFVIEIVFKA